MIVTGALLAIICAGALAANLNTTNTLNHSDVNKLLNISSLGAPDSNSSRTFINSELVTKLATIIKNNTVDSPKNNGENEPYNVLNNDRKDHIRSGPIEESPDYASSVVLASDLLSLTQAVANVKDKVCQEQGYKFLDGLLLKKRWALKMFDASAKSPQGLLFGSSYHLGNFDECIYVQDSNDDGPTVKGQYCLATIDWPEAKEAKKARGRGGSLRWAVCVPDACNATTVKDFVNDIIANVIGTNISVSVTERDCSTARPLIVTKSDTGFLSVMLVFATFTILSTVYELVANYLWQKRSSVVHELVVCFSLINNGKKLLSTKQNTSLGLECIAGIKAISMFLIIFGHACMFTISGPVMNPDAIIKLNQVPIYGFMLNSMLLVDTFLMLSAFLFCRLTLIELDKRKGKVNFLPILLFRYIRLTPAYLVVILFYMTWLPKIGDGPLWKEKMELEQQRCIDSWWTNLLYVNNYVQSDRMCMFQSWYLSVDSQLFFIAPIFIYSLWRWKRMGLTLLGIGTAVSLIIPSVITYEKRLDPSFMIYADEVRDLTSNNYFNKVYVKTHMKITPYFVGLITGYLLHRIQKDNYQFSKMFKFLGWTTCIILGVITAFSITVFYQDWYEYSRSDAAAYVSLHKLAWCIVNCWILICCATGNGGILYKLLSSKFLMPISRLTYCAYLMNGVVELYYVGEVQSPMYFSDLNLFANAIAHLALTFLLAVVLCITLESPILGIEKIMLKLFDRRVSRDEDKKAESGSSHNTSQTKLET